MNSRSFCKATGITIQNHLDTRFNEQIARDVMNGLTAPQKYLPSKYFYDARGSQLFEEICLLPEYYLTRTEMAILKGSAKEIMKKFRGGDLIELGSGANWKIRMLIEAVDISQRSRIRYVPVDVSASALIEASEELLDIYPEIEVMGIIADFVHPMEFIPSDRDKLITFFGSTIGNLDEEECHVFLRSISENMKEGDRFVFGLDMLKPREIIEAAYNDSRNITSEFNKNILNVVNRELNGDFDPSHFDHVAFFNEEKEQIEMHLRANRRVVVEIGDLNLSVTLERGETIRTEISRKFSRESAEAMISKAGLGIEAWFSDPEEWFSLLKLSPA